MGPDSPQKKKRKGREKTTRKTNKFNGYDISIDSKIHFILRQQQKRRD
jgi:hypothetical protein